MFFSEIIRKINKKFTLLEGFYHKNPDLWREGWMDVPLNDWFDEGLGMTFRDREKFPIR